MAGTNICAGVASGPNRAANVACVEDGITVALEQAAGNVTVGYQGLNENTAGVPITVPYTSTALCPVNVHWHLGAEHLSVGQYDEGGKGPSHHEAYTDAHDDYSRRKMAEGAVRMGHNCYYFDPTDTRFTVDYEWKHCVNTHVGETYEVHWPHSAVGACGTPNQYQTPFYDGVFCNPAGVDLGSLTPEQVSQSIGVQGQVFTIINDENYYYPDLMRGMIVEGEYGKDMAFYTGSTTGTSRNNEICSPYAPITWQVDRKCHLISASSFDKMCADMKTQRDDMSYDLYPHGARITVADHLAANNIQRD